MHEHENNLAVFPHVTTLEIDRSTLADVIMALLNRIIGKTPGERGPGVMKYNLLERESA